MNPEWYEQVECDECGEKVPEDDIVEVEVEYDSYQGDYVEARIRTDSLCPRCFEEQDEGVVT